MPQAKTKPISKGDSSNQSQNLRSPICVILGHVDTGKCLARDTKILLANGKIEKVQNIKPGDLLMGDDETPRKVISINKGYDQLFKITNTLKESFEANKEHILTLVVSKEPIEIQNEENSQIRTVFWLENHHLKSKEFTQEMESQLNDFVKQKQKKGNKIGDTIDISIEEYLRKSEKWKEYYYSYKVSAEFAPQKIYHNPKKAGNYLAANYLTGKNYLETKKMEDQKFISNFAKYHKDHQDSIPYELKCNTKQTRSELLKGILETKGVEEEGKYIIGGLREKFAEDVVYLSRSLGLHSTMEQTKSENLETPEICERNYTVIIGKSNIEEEEKRIQTYAFKVEKTKYGDYYGFIIDHNNRFLLGDFTVTHNTKLLDKIRHSKVQDGEVGGITQQIGATYFPIETIKKQTKSLNKQNKYTYDLPGLLIIDTPGHESFANLRSRGSSLCDIAILVVDIHHGLEPQTKESINLLRKRKTPFVVALNKIDRLTDWKANPWSDFKQSLRKQGRNTKDHFQKKLKDTITAFNEEALNAELYYNNPNIRKYVSLVPTSAITGEGIPDLLMLLVQITQKRMSKTLRYLSELQCTVLEVKIIDGLGTTIDVILANGVLNQGDTIVICGREGAIVTTIRALLTPQPLKELRIKSEYMHHTQLKAAQGCKIAAAKLEFAVPGSPLLIPKNPNDPDELEFLKQEVMKDFNIMLSSVDKSGKGVYVQSSTLGALEALLEFLRESKIPVSGINIGPVHKKDVEKISIMIEKQKEYAIILAFDVKVMPEARELAQKRGVKIFTADIIYHLFDQFKLYMEQLQREKENKLSTEIVFPCQLSIISDYIFNTKDPIIMGVDIEEGSLRIGTPIVANLDENNSIYLGRVISIEKERAPVHQADKGSSVSIKIMSQHSETSYMYGRHFDSSHKLYSRLSRKSIDALKERYGEKSPEMPRDNWLLVIKIKKILKID
ncbi:intein-containing eukaryotic translation initiation factor 5b precursor [Anaeramoeba ignava]|uniref:Eukaryotic translation initiation factor 5B n=1 Tax=Anaeramoeba ignava TaxID=1746090 RepID=A0A9Q0R8H3_ANAIG|nr:intein-containing eukaryotic translation initiation factor 5b precursor [Anaeramoeba ignava]